MARQKPSAPPRPIARGDVVAAFSDSLGEWTAAQITDVDIESRRAGVLELDWSGPEPSSVADLGAPAPLRLTHHSWNGGLSHCNYEWVLPRSYKVIGMLPPLAERSSSYSSGWRLGEQLARQRHWDAGHRESWSDPHTVRCTGTEINQAFDGSAEFGRDIRSLTVTKVESLDCDLLAGHFPGLTELSLWGDLGLLSAASSLNRLTSLKRLRIQDLFGMSAADRLLPQHVPALESVCLHSVPAVYATAMRSAWRPEIPNGTNVDITAPRKPEWVALNRTNPLRDWDGREHISGACYKKAVAQYGSTWKAVMAALSDTPAEDLPARLFRLGEEYGEGFNMLDARTGFIETVERDELFSALDFMVSQAEATLGRDLTAARTSLTSGVESVRDW